MAVDIDALWDHSKPQLSEQRFREALAGASGEEVLLLQTQIARTHGIRKDFARAREILAAIAPQAGAAAPPVRVRYLLELGRTYASATHAQAAITPAERELARASFLEAFEVARTARLDALAIDALHMMAFVDTEPGAQLAWDTKALAHMEGSDQPDAKKWEASLRNNVGYARHLLGEYDEALRQFRLSLAAHERAGRARAVRIAHWMIAWTLRAQRKFDEAIAIQLRLEREWQEANEPDPYVFEELEHLYRATGDTAQAEAYAQKLRAARK
jgi:tetratricopeptide (TPR) repeat protein